MRTRYWDLVLVRFSTDTELTLVKKFMVDVRRSMAPFESWTGRVRKWFSGLAVVYYSHNVGELIC